MRGRPLSQVLNHRSVNAAYVPTFTVVKVQWADGTTAEFVPTNSVPTEPWVIVPGRARKSGQPINLGDGTLLLNANPGSGSGAGVFIPTITGTYNPSWTIDFTSGSGEVGDVASIFPDGSQIVEDFFLP